MTYYLGIDGGGSKTTCAIGDDVSQIATSTAGPSNITRVGESRARESLRQAITEACVAAGITPKQVRRACIGAAGAGRQQVASILKRIIAELVPGEIEVVGDMPIMLEAAFDEEPGVVVNAGTGSFAFGRDANGTTARAGGWGFAISDEGSAHWIGRAAVAGLLRVMDRDVDAGRNIETVAEASPFFKKLKAVWNLDSFSEFVRTANSNPDFAALFPAILAGAEDGDAVAKQVLDEAGVELAQLAGVVVRRLFAKNAAVSTVPVALAGGVFRHSQGVREVFCAEIQKLRSRVQVNPHVVDPVAGALRMARRHK